MASKTAVCYSLSADLITTQPVRCVPDIVGTDTCHCHQTTAKRPEILHDPMKLTGSAG